MHIDWSVPVNWEGKKWKRTGSGEERQWRGNGEDRKMPATETGADWQYELNRKGALLGAETLLYCTLSVSNPYTHKG